MKRQSKLQAFFEVSRANLLLASIGHATIGLFLGAGSLNALFNIIVPLYIALHYSIALLACNINCLYDYDVDKRYKRYMSDSVDMLGRGRLKVFISAEFAAATLLITFFFNTGRFFTGVAAVFGVLAAIVYSAEPFRVKKRGFLSPLPILFGLYMLPLFGGWFVFKDSLSIPFLVFVVGYALMNEGFTLVNMCEDYSEDKVEGIRTWAHVFGLKKTLKLASFFSFSGLLCVLSLAYILYVGFTGYSYSGLPAFLSLVFTAVLILKAGLEVNQVRYGSDLEARAKLYGKRLQRWFMMTRYPLMLTTFLLLIQL
ncbi:MAG: UbiA prenyltransferase family protein [Thermoplasmata archaeon]|nr:UbiA prenyltransferase family protein [Thermoplasmata archaeon]